MGLLEASAASKVYSDDGEHLRDLHVPTHLSAPPAPLLPAPEVEDESAAASSVLKPIEFGDDSMSAAELHTVPQGTSGEAGAEAVARRVRERREELQARVRQRVNLYGAEEDAVETAEAVATKAQEKVEGSGALAGALLGF